MSDVTQDGKIAAQKGNDMSVLDELRAALEETPCPRYYDFGPECISVEDAQKIVDTFAAAHPGLVEVVPCRECLHGTMTETDHVWCRKNGHREQDDYCSYGQRKEATT